MKKSHIIILVIVLIAGSSLITQSDWYKSEADRVAKADSLERALNAKENARSMIPQNVGPDGVVWQVQKYLEKNLHDPGSYESVSWGKVQTSDSIRFTVSHTYRAKSKLGAVVKETKVFTLDGSGQILKTN